MPRWLIGVMINILGSVSINFGTNLMKLAHNDKERAARAEDARLEKERREVSPYFGNLSAVEDTQR